MKKFLPYILGLLLLTSIVVLFLTGNNKTKNRKLDERITLRRQDKIPYGTYVAYQNLEHIFPDAQIMTNRLEPGNWDSISKFDEDQALVVITRFFNASEDEMRDLIRFIENGNDVFVSAKSVSYNVEKMLECSVYDPDEPVYYEDAGWVGGSRDTLKVSLVAPPYKTPTVYEYPGIKYQSSFTKLPYRTTETLGNSEGGIANFIHLKAGRGNFYLHLSPISFSNYFLLHKNNIGYYENALSVINPDVKKLVWDEYYLNKRQYNGPRDKKKGWFAVLMGMENEDGKHPFRAAFWLLIGLLVIFTLMEMRRKQRYIPVIAKPRNDSLDFVKTIGRLYYDRGDHKNLCRKMSAYFLEHVRNQYKLPTSNLDETFIRNLQYKSGVPENEINEIVSFIKQIEETGSINATQLREFHRKLEFFYSKA